MKNLHNLAAPFSVINFDEDNTRGNKQRYHMKYCEVHTLFRATKANVCKKQARMISLAKKTPSKTTRASCGPKDSSEVTSDQEEVDASRLEKYMCRK